MRNHPPIVAYVGEKYSTIIFRDIPYKASVSHEDNTVVLRSASIPDHEAVNPSAHTLIIILDHINSLLSVPYYYEHGDIRSVKKAIEDCLC